MSRTVAALLPQCVAAGLRIPHAVAYWLTVDPELEFCCGSAELSELGTRLYGASCDVNIGAEEACS